MERREAEVVEEIFAVLEIVQLRAGDQQQDRLDARVALAQRAAQRERAFGIVVGAHDRARSNRRRGSSCIATAALATDFHR